MEKEQTEDMGYFEEVTNINCKKDDEIINDSNIIGNKQNVENKNLNKDEKDNFKYILKLNFNKDVNSDFDKSCSNKSAAETVLNNEKDKLENKNQFINKSKSQEIMEGKIEKNNLINIQKDNNENEDENINNNCKINNNSINININKKEVSKDFYNNRYAFENIKKDIENEVILKNKINNEKEKVQVINNKKENTIEIPQIKKTYNDYFVDDPEIKIMRLSDMDNNSYLNSTLRCLLSIDELKNFFLNEEEVKNIYNSAKEEKRLSFAIQRLFFHVYLDKKNKIYTLEKIKDVLKEESPYFAQNSEMNPNICLNFILYQMDNELNVKKDNNSFINYNQYNEKEVLEKGKENFLKNNDSIISKTFSWYELSKAKCNKCNDIKYKFKSFFTFDLDIQSFHKERKLNVISINDCLALWSSKKKLLNIYCDSCNSLSEIENSKSIVGTPKFFLFILDRGNFNEQLMNLNFIIDSEIDIQPYCENIQESTKYELNAIVSIFNKKYISLVKNDENSWLLFDDSKIQMIENNLALNENYNSDIKHIPCILLYKLLKNK